MMHDENHLPKKGKQKAEEHTESLKENSFLFLKKKRDFFFLCVSLCVLCVGGRTWPWEGRNHWKVIRKHVDNSL